MIVDPEVFSHGLTSIEWIGEYRSKLLRIKQALSSIDMVEAAALLREAVHTVSSATSLGLMSSGPRAHCLEGRRWDEFCAALGGDRSILSRPPLGKW